MRISLLTVGDELLIGQVLNSNVQWMSERLTEIGASVTQHLTVGDTVPEIKRALDFVVPNSDAVIVGGGLGPTHDDLTMDALSEYFDIPLEYDADWISKVDAYFKSRNRVMSENNKKQGYLLKTATRIDNDCGTAAGQHLSQKNLDLFVVPGVPHEMKSMFEGYVLPALTKKIAVEGETILKETLLATGLGESLLAERCDRVVQKIKTLPNVTLAFLPASTQVRLRLQMRAKTREDEEQFRSLVHELKECCGKDFFGFDPVTLEEIVVHQLRDQKQTLALAESCTGGLLSHRITQVPGASAVLKGALVPYQTGLKELELGIPASLIEQNGVVSEETARAMAEAIRKRWNATYGISTTGYLGPQGGDAFAKVGTVWVAVTDGSITQARMFIFESHRERAKERAAQAALDLFRRTF